MKDFHIVVSRNSDEENTVAIVSATCGDTVETGRDLFDLLVKMVCEWVEISPQARRLKASNGGDINIGDLSWHITDELLGRLMKKHGITNLCVECHSSPSCCWVFDDNLAAKGRGS